MTFLNPLVLFGLAAASIPLILHLLNLRKLRTIEFSTLTFLKELQRTSIHRLKLRQILLLIVRTALIVAIVLAFARPALRGSILGTIGTHAHTSVLILLDDSFSMAASEERGELFKQAKEIALELIGMLKEGDEAFLLRLSDLPQLTMEVPTHDFSELNNLIRESSLSFADGSLDEAMRTYAKVLASTHNANKEVYVVSDIQRAMFQRLGPINRTGAENLFAPETKFFCIRLGSQNVDNATVDSVSIISRIFEKGKPVNITARVSNFGNLPLRDYVVSAYLDGSHAAQRNIDVQAWGSTTVDFTVTPNRSGFISGYIATEQDAIDQDNKRYFTFTVPENIRVAFVSPSREDVRFISLALTASVRENNPTLFTVQFTTPQQFYLVDLKNIDVLILSNVPSFATPDVERITLFLEQGGGVLIFPGSSMIDESYNRTLFQKWKIPPFEGRNGTAGETQSSLVFQDIDTEHPIFAGVFESEGTKKKFFIESPQVFLSMKRQTGQHGRTIISMSDRTPFLSEYRIGEGTVLLFSSAPALAWTDFPVKGIFAPLIFRSVLYTVAGAEHSSGFTVGEEPVITLQRTPEMAKGIAAQRFTLQSPGGTEELLQPQFQSTSVRSTVMFSGKKLTEPGVFKIRTGQTILAQFAVNVSQKESDLRKIPDAELENFFKTLGVGASQITLVKSDGKLNSVVLQSRYGVELWKFFLATALMLALIEMSVARGPRAEHRDASAASGE